MSKSASTSAGSNYGRPLDWHVDDHAPKHVDENSESQHEATFDNGACRLRLFVFHKQIEIDDGPAPRYASAVIGRTTGYNPSAEPVNLSQYSIEDLERELNRRKDEQRPTYAKDSGVGSVQFFLATWGDVLGQNKTISKQRVRAHDSYLMDLIESFISNRIAAKKDLGGLEGITFLVNEEKSNNRSRRYTRRKITAPSPR